MSKKEVLIALGIALLLGVFISPFASDFPDGLERVASDKLFIEEAKDSPLPSKFGDYTFPIFKNESIQTALAGLFGTLAVFLVTIICVKIIALRKKSI